MDIVRRVQDILLKPRETWPTIASEPGDVASLYKNYLLILAAIPPLAGFIGMSLIGFGFIRIPLMFGLSSMVAQYVLTLVMVQVASQSFGLSAQERPSLMFELPAPTGQSPIGTTRWLVSDPSRHETFAAVDTPRQVADWYGLTVDEVVARIRELLP